MFYHARITIKPERVKEAPKIAFEADMTRPDILQKIVLPFIRGGMFICGGMVIQSSRVEEVKFSETEQASSELLPMMEARRRLSGVISASPTRWELVWEGRDVTRKILDEGTSSQESQSSSINSEPAPEISDRVFIVHGHDNQAVDQTEIIIRRFGLTPVILREAPSAGRTVIEKLEAYKSVGLAVVLLTPDDLGGISEEHLAPRARQNVIWEWGYLVSHLGRDRVICLYKGNVEMPSDLYGLVTIHIGDDVRSSLEEIRREFLAAGYRV